MAEAKKVPEKKANEAKSSASTKKNSAKSRYSKGQTLTCEVCGLSIAVEEIGDVVVEEESMLLCCGKPMKDKATAKKAAKK